MREEQSLRKVDLFDPYAPRGPTTSLFERGPNPIAGIERLLIGMLEQIQLENAHKAQERQTGPRNGLRKVERTPCAVLKQRQYFSMMP